MSSSDYAGQEATVDVVPGASRSPAVVHVPHASRSIPEWVRESIVLDDVALVGELDAMTDAHTDVIAAAAADSAAVRPWQFVNRASRLVVDPERFPDDREEMAAVGMGAVYTRTSSGAVLRPADPGRDRRLLADFFEPYALRFADEVDARLAATGRAVVLDVHSYPREPLPYELHQEDSRPAICLGVDRIHTPDRLLAAARDAFSVVGDIAVDQPFRGTYVPLRHYGCDERVESLMIEIRRDMYMRPDGSTDPVRVAALARAMASLISEVSGSDAA